MVCHELLIATQCICTFRAFLNMNFFQNAGNHDRANRGNKDGRNREQKERDHRAEVISENKTCYMTQLNCNNMSILFARGNFDHLT
jgi:hypothetical protein